jgi:hypothetical protein
MRKQMSKAIEQRIYPFAELRVSEDTGIMAGHIAVFNQWSVDLGGFKERVLPGAFSESLAEDDVLSSINHNLDKLLGRTSSGTLRLVEDDVGLAFEVDVPSTSYGNDLKVSAQRGDIRGCSFMFRVDEDRWYKDEAVYEDGDVRELVKVKLIEGGPVALPAYPQTDAALRAVSGVGCDFDALGKILSDLPADRNVVININPSEPAHTVPEPSITGDVKPLVDEGDVNSAPVDRNAILRRRFEIVKRS